MGTIILLRIGILSAKILKISQNFKNSIIHENAQAVQMCMVIYIRGGGGERWHCKCHFLIFRDIQNLQIHQNLTITICHKYYIHEKAIMHY
jgi:hypothetical protein